MEEPRWLADEMLGRLARYLRFLGYDTEYVRGRPDDEIARKAAADNRVLLTRDRDLAGRVARSLRLESSDLDDQLRAVRAAFPDLRGDVAFTRCTLCNGILAAWAPDPGEPWPAEVPMDRAARGLAVYRCEACRHLFWEGSHSASVRARLLRLRGTPSR